MDFVSEYLASAYNIKEFDLILYCWNLYNNEKEIIDFAKLLGIDDIVTYPRIVGDLLRPVKNAIKEKNSYASNVNRPNTSMIRIIYDALKYGNEYLSIDDFAD